MKHQEKERGGVKNSTALVASDPALTFFLKKVRFSITRRTGLVLEIRLFLLTVIFVEKISNELITSQLTDLVYTRTVKRRVTCTQLPKNYQMKPNGLHL